MISFTPLTSLKKNAKKKEGGGEVGSREQWLDCELNSTFDALAAVEVEEEDQSSQIFTFFFPSGSVDGIHFSSSLCGPLHCFKEAGSVPLFTLDNCIFFFCVSHINDYYYSELSL